jgi:hypothetical protein
MERMMVEMMVVVVDVMVVVGIDCCISGSIKRRPEQTGEGGCVVWVGGCVKR